MAYRTGVEKLLAEVTRLRAALEILADPESYRGDGSSIPVKVTVIAQAALRGSQAGGAASGGGR